MPGWTAPSQEYEPGNPEKMMFDLKITGGRIVDGTGAPAYDGEVAIKDGLIAAVGASVPGEATKTLDAQGRIVTPGFVDVHTHYDGQVTWDDNLDPSGGHGVTTVVMGNCGVGFAPVAPGKQEFLIGLMEGVEDIPGSALHEGIDWQWETFPEYLDALDKRKYTMDIGTHASEFCHMEESLREDTLGDDRVSVSHRHHRHQLRLQVSGIARVWLCGHMHGSDVTLTSHSADRTKWIGIVEHIHRHPRVEQCVREG